MITEKSTLAELIGELEPYTRENWDDEGASPITSAALYSAVEVLNSLPNVEKPHLSPIVDGSIGLFWDMHGIYLDIQVLPLGDISLMYRLPDGQEKSGRFGNDSIIVLAEALRPAIGYIVKPTPTEMLQGIATGSVFSAFEVTFGSSEKPEGLTAA